MTNTKNFIYDFHISQTLVSPDKSTLGGKGFNLAIISSLGLPVPPGFTISSDACLDYYKDLSISNHIWEQIKAGVKRISSITGRNFGDKTNPLLVSVRSGAKISMPGMMDTILNLGLNDLNVQVLAEITQNKCFAYDSYRRFIEMYASVVMGVEHSALEAQLNNIKDQHNLKHDWELSPELLQHVIKIYKDIIFEKSGENLPQDVWQQLKRAICAVFSSWNSSRAIKYRSLHGISDDWGTAVNIQSMVFGNMGSSSLTGVLFTRDPSDGNRHMFGEFLINCQGEDLVSGLRTPRQITTRSRLQIKDPDLSLEEIYPEIFAQLSKMGLQLERHFKDMQDIEFTVEQGKIWLLQTRNGKRSVKAAVKIAMDMLQEELIDSATALKRIDPKAMEKILHQTIDDTSEFELLTKGLPASPGAASGVVIFNPLDAEKISKLQKVILVRRETSPEDIGGMAAAEGILTVKGGMTSHAAVVARGMGKPCVSGASKIVINIDKNLMIIGSTIVKAGEMITINGSTGEVIKGEVPTVGGAVFPEFYHLMKLADDTKALSIRANAETFQDAETAKKFGADGIGLCRTEHMFFVPEKILAVRKMILLPKESQNEKVLDELLSFQTRDFEILFEVMGGMPITIRLLDPPLHEFLPVAFHEIENFAQHSNLTVRAVSEIVKQLSETNPMLGHRGARLGLTHPTIYQMQIRAIFEAASAVQKRHNIAVKPEIMIPFIIDQAEVLRFKTMISEIAIQYPDIHYLFGIMIELPRAALQAHTIAPLIDFCSFGTNDLTQTTLGISRDDAGQFLSQYINEKILLKDPFVSIDEAGVGELMKNAIQKIKNTKPEVKIGVCGEHGGDPDSIAFFSTIGVDYVSCSPYRIPIAKLSAAQAFLSE